VRHILIWAAVGLILCAFVLAKGSEDMADTQRSVAECLALLADNSKGLISEQDLRDTAVTLQPGYGICHTSTPAETDTSSGGWVKVVGASTLGAYYRFESLGQTDLIYNGAADCLASIIACCTFVGVPGHTYEIALGLNGSEIAQSVQTLFVPTDGEEPVPVCMTLAAMQVLQATDQITIRAQAQDGATILTMSNCTLTAQALAK